MFSTLNHPETRSRSLIFIGAILFLSHQSSQSKAPSQSKQNLRKKTFDFNAFSLEKADTINKALDEAVALREPETIQGAMRYSLLADGKSFRPMLCIAASDLVDDSQEMVIVAA
ncbi:hypothetical protein RIF29_12367 [Crotalaria pallida]|uniref:Uncharacterized protein n=1 Tax=Crotalaria pallida TaxID=3830 RepID=A0AAN9IN28_CROPI